MLTLRPGLVALLAVGLLGTAPSATDATGRVTSGGMRKVQPLVTCTIVVGPEGGATPVSTGQTLRHAGTSHRYSIFLALRNGGLTAQTLGAMTILNDGGRVSQWSQEGIQLAPGQVVHTQARWLELGTGTHRMRAGGTFLLKGNTASTDCGTVDFTVEVGTAPAQSTARAQVIPDLTCDVRVEWVHPSGARSAVTGGTLEIPESHPNFRAYIRVMNGLPVPYGSNVKVDLRWSTGSGQLVERQFTIQGPITPGGDGAYSPFVDVSIPDGRSVVSAQGQILDMPTNRSRNATGRTDCLNVAFTASVGGGVPGAPGTIPAAYFTSTIYPLLTRPGCLTCHQTQEITPQHPDITADRNCTRCHGSAYINIQAKPYLAFRTTTVKSAPELCAGLGRRVIPGYHATNPGPLGAILSPITPDAFQSMLTNWRDFGGPPGYRCP